MDKKRKTLQQQFIQHCAVIIQSRWKGYIQRKRYRRFLPIYRRVKQLLLSIYSGWKIRKIFELRSIKTQISSIKDRLSKGHLSQVRIAKRQLIDEIARLSKKGHWIDEFKRCKTKQQNSIDDSKQNCSLYANVKSKSIKNIFKSIVKSDNNKGEITNKSLIKQNKPIDNIEAAKTMHNFDDIPIKINRNHYCQQQKDGQVISKNKQFQKIKPMLRKSTKPRIKNAEKEQQNKHDQNLLQTVEPNLKKKMKSLMTNYSVTAIKQEQLSNDQILKQSIMTGSKHRKNKKLHITISKSSTCRQEELSEKVIPQYKNQIRLSFIQKGMELQMSRLINSKVSNKPNQRDIYALIQTYESTYSKKKQQIKQKISYLDTRYTKSMGFTYQKIISNLGTQSI